MSRAKMIYATILAAIYVAASAMSSLSVLWCDHPHHTHHEEEQTECCCCHHDDVNLLIAHADTATYDAECCDHSHELLGDDNAQYVVDNERDNSVCSLANLLLTSVAIVDTTGAINTHLTATERLYRGDESLPLSAAFSRYDSLRAPPALA